MVASVVLLSSQTQHEPLRPCLCGQILLAAPQVPLELLGYLATQRTLCSRQLSLYDVV